MRSESFKLQHVFLLPLLVGRSTSHCCTAPVASLTDLTSEVNKVAISVAMLSRTILCWQIQEYKKVSAGALIQADD